MRNRFYLLSSCRVEHFWAVGLCRDGLWRIPPTYHSSIMAVMPSDYLELARALGPTIQAHAIENERSRQLAPALLDALIEAGMFRMLLARDFGGAEIEPAVFVQVLEEVAKSDGSTAWVLGQTSGCSMVAAYLSPDRAHEIFGQPRSILAWGPPAGDTRAVRVPGGYQVTGRWNFASGMRHASWRGGSCPIYESDGTPVLAPTGAIVERTVLFPAGEVTVHDVWDVLGLRGTGSDSLSVSDVFVPEDLTVSRDDPAERRNSRPLYCFPTTSLFASGFAGVALGIARSELDDFTALARTKTGRGAARALGNNPAVHSQLAQAEGRLRAARAFLLATVTEVWEHVVRDGALSIDQRLQIRLAASHAIKESREVVDFAYHYAGSSPIFASSSMERRFRDMHTLTQQIQGRPDHFENVGQALLGLPPETSFI